MRRIVYGIILIVAIVGLSLSIKPAQHMVTPFDVVTPELKKDLLSSCAEQCCKDEVNAMKFGFGLYSKNEKDVCPEGFMPRKMSCNSGAYCQWVKEKTNADVSVN